MPKITTTEGAVAEVPTRVLREQLGEKLAKAAGADFSAPIVQRKKEPPVERKKEPEARPAALPPRSGKRERPSTPAEKKFQRPRRGEGARPSFEERAPKRGGHPKRGRR